MHWHGNVLIFWCNGNGGAAVYSIWWSDTEDNYVDRMNSTRVQDQNLLRIQRDNPMRVDGSNTPQWPKSRFVNACKCFFPRGHCWGVPRHRCNSLVANPGLHVRKLPRLCRIKYSQVTIRVQSCSHTQMQGMACTLRHRIMMWKWETHYTKGFILFTQYKLESVPFSVHEIWHRCTHKHSCRSFSMRTKGWWCYWRRGWTTIDIAMKYMAQVGSSLVWEGCA